MGTCPINSVQKQIKSSLRAQFLYFSLKKLVLELKRSKYSRGIYLPLKRTPEFIKISRDSLQLFPLLDDLVLSDLNDCFVNIQFELYRPRKYRLHHESESRYQDCWKQCHTRALPRIPCSQVSSMDVI